MTKKDLEKLDYLRKELDDLEERKRQKRKKTSGVVEGSTVLFPFIKRSIPISGEYDLYTDDNIDELRTQAETKIRKEIARIEEWMRTVDDPRLCLIIRYKYIDGCSWRGVAKRMGIIGDGSTERKYLETNIKKYPDP